MDSAARSPPGIFAEKQRWHHPGNFEEDRGGIASVMNRHQKPLQQRHKNPAYRSVFERLDQVLDENTRVDNVELMRRMRAAYFADVDRLQQSGRVVIPK
jgi:hypothetical protein